MVDTIKPILKVKQSKEHGFTQCYNKLEYSYWKYKEYRELKDYKNAKIFFKQVTRYYWILYSGRGIYKLNEGKI